MSDETFNFGNVQVESHKTLHDVSTVGLKFNGRLAISGDTPFAEEYLAWLRQGSELLFYEFGYAGSHTTEQDIPKVLASHANVKLYHMPYPVKRIMLEQGAPIAERRWYEV